MSSKTFSTIPQEECVSAYEELIKNSDAKWKAALDNAASGEYGIASSLCVVSVEELIKAILLCLDSQGFEFRRVKGMDILFKNHQIRHYIAYWLFAMNWVMNEFMKFIKKAIDNPEWAMVLMEDVKQEDYVERKMKFYLLRQLILLKSELDWFSKVDNIRQDGFYAGYIDELKNPVNISVNQFEDVCLRLSFVRTIGKAFITEISKKEKFLCDLINEQRIQFKKEGHYAKIEFLLKELRASKKGPFEMFNKIAGIEKVT